MQHQEDAEIKNKAIKEAGIKCRKEYQWQWWDEIMASHGVGQHEQDDFFSPQPGR